jgi:Ni/Fe-hydrogenase subunit HybB-like protein
MATVEKQVVGHSKLPSPHGTPDNMTAQAVHHPGQRPTEINNDLTRNVTKVGWKWFAVLGFFMTILGWATICFVYQLYEGIGVYGNMDPVYWAVPIINFVFWAGVALSGTMISAILRLFHAGWRRSLTRMTETLTICALAVAGTFPLLHIGRNWFFYEMVPYPNERQLWPNYRSPLIWDATALSVYLATSTLFWLGGLIPDFALLRDRTIGIPRIIYTILSFGWRGTDREWRRLKGLFIILTVMIIPVFVSLHTIVGYDFGMSLVPGWHENIFAPYFVCGALYSGCGAVLIIMYFVRKGFHLEKYILPQQFDNIAKIQFLISLLWFCFFAGDAWADWFSGDQAHVHWIEYMFHGYHAVLWTILFFGIIVPYSMLWNKNWRKTPLLMMLMGISVNIAMFAERITVIVPPSSHNYLVWHNYTPTWISISITAGAVGLFGFLYTLLTKFIPIISLWEYKEGEHGEFMEHVGGTDIPVTVREEAIA